MKPILTLLTVLALTSAAAHGEQPATDTVRDRLWVFAPPADGPRLYYESAGYRGGSRMTPVEGAFWLGVPNLLFITQDWNRPPSMWTEKSWKAKTTKEQYAIAFEPLKRVQWAAVGSGGRGGLKEVPDIITLAKSYPNFTGIYLDDFVKDPVKQPDGRKVGKPKQASEHLTLMKTQILALLLAPLSTLHAAEPSTAPSGPPPDRKWKLVWSDEFDGKTLDTTKWFRKQPGMWNWPGIKTSPEPSNLDLDGQGHCVVQLTRDPDGTVRHPGSIVSKFEKAYGYFETRVQFSRQPGWWSAVWLAGFPYECGVDTFTSPQEFDIFEDFYKPKKQNDIQHCYHCSTKLAQLPGDQGNATGIGEGAILRSAKLSRTSAARKVVMDDYSGWHTVGFRWTPLEHVFYVDGRETLRQDYRDVPVTNVPQRLYISACLRTPKSADDKPFYGRLEEAQLPDKLVVDYVRVYEEDTEPLKAPEVTLTTDKPGPFRVGEPVTFHVKATAPGRKVSSVMLFSMGRLRAETALEAPASSTETTFTVTNLFPGVVNTVIATAKDDASLVGQSAILRTDVLTGKEYTATPWQGVPQKIPGTVRGGCYDEGGNGVAFRSAVIGPSDVRLEHRKTELGDLPEAVGVGGDRATWITYEVDVATSGEYDAELFMNRPDYATKHLDPATPVRDERIRMNLGASGPAGASLAEWTLPATWHSGVGWRNPQKSLGKQKVRLPAGRHKLVMCFDGIRAGHTYFCKLVFAPASAQQATPEAASSGLTPDRK